jgi:hypothetical protein
MMHERKLTLLRNYSRPIMENTARKSMPRVALCQDVTTFFFTYLAAIAYCLILHRGGGKSRLNNGSY